MSETNTGSNLDHAVEMCARRLSEIRAEIEKQFIGQSAVVDQVLTSLLANGHILVEGVPGLGKTLLVKSLAQVMGGEFSRIQFTPDLMPADITGHSMFNMKTQEFEIKKGPAFTNFLLADEINRAPAKSQSALLEVMQEQQITIEGTTMATPKPFLVLATQNPIEQDGTYPLPEAELDRFMMKIFIGYPERQHELDMIDSILFRTKKHVPITKLMGTEELIKWQKLVMHITVDDQVKAYAVNLVRTTREWHGISRGAGPRGSLALIASAKAMALLQGTSFVTPDHIKKVALPVLRHRILLSADLEIEGTNTDNVISDLLEKVEAPRK